MPRSSKKPLTPEAQSAIMALPHTTYMALAGDLSGRARRFRGAERLRDFAARYYCYSLPSQYLYGAKGSAKPNARVGARMAGDLAQPDRLVDIAQRTTALEIVAERCGAVHERSVQRIRAAKPTK